MKEIGGYFELECGNNMPFHKNGILLNSARNCLSYFIRCVKIKKIYVPNYTCPVIFDAIKNENCKITFYNIDDNFLPQMEFAKDSYVLYNNYFGIHGKNVAYLAKTYPNLIVDNAQAFYAEQQGIASFYSPRKFFGLPDGGVLLTKAELPILEERDKSFARCSHLLKRLDVGANFGFFDFQENDASISGLEPQKMSVLTERLMGNIHYEIAKQKRMNNFYFIHEKIEKINKLKISLHKNDVPMVYPLFLEVENIREKLIANNIYVAKYWPDATNNFSKYILPLPIDQRYDIEDMEFILEVLKEYL